MSQVAKVHGSIVLLFGFFITFAGCSDKNAASTLDPETGKHITGWANPDSHGTWAKKSDSEGGFADCQACHQDDFSGGISNVSCFTCHGVNAPHPSAWRSGTRMHQNTDESNAPVCAVCHANGANSPITLVTPAPAGTAPGCFNNTLCHGQGHPAGWANPDQHGASAKSQASGFSTCQSCHGSDFAGGTVNTSCFTCHGVNAPHPPTPWITSPTSTRTHTTTNTGNAAVCANCHTGGANMTSLPTPTNPATGTPGCFNNTLCHGQLGHPAGWDAPASHGAAAKLAPNVANVTGFSTCQTCHAANFTGGTSTISCLNTTGCHGASVSAPHAPAPWRSSMTHTTTDQGNATVCGYCHEGESSNGNHPYATPTGPVTCFDNTLCHGSPSALGCVNCHNAAIGSPTAQGIDASVTQRRAIVPEFQQTWSHKRSAAVSGDVANQDCAVCHMEGNVADGSRNLTYHGNGYIELRDPDTGSTIKQATWSNSPAGTGSFASGATDARFVRFSRNLAIDLVQDANYATLGGIMINQCLHCHDANGATNAAARVPGGTALKPFNTTITGHAAPFDSNGNGNVVNVAAQFATTNSSYHPISGKQNNSYVQGAMMQAPWNLTKTTGNTTSWGYLMTCWDCHAPNGATGTQRLTVTAHGGAATLRAPVYQSAANTAATNLCVNCHALNYATTSGNHAAGSAFTGGSSNMNLTTMQRCAYCHAYTAAQAGTAVPTLALRPLRGENVHGFNDRDPVTAGQQLWVNGANSHRPYAFIRNTLAYWSPTSVSTAGETLQRSRGCTGTGGTCNNNMDTNTTYSTGGVY